MSSWNRRVQPVCASCFISLTFILFGLDGLVCFTSLCCSVLGTTGLEFSSVIFNLSCTSRLNSSETFSSSDGLAGDRWMFTQAGCNGLAGFRPQSREAQPLLIALSSSKQYSMDGSLSSGYTASRFTNTRSAFPVLGFTPVGSESCFCIDRGSCPCML